MSGLPTSSTCELGVNVDHVATVREARKTMEPDPVPAALDAELGGADQIVIHLRKDRRHVQERDLDLLSRTVQTKLNLEMSTEPDIVDIAIDHAPDRVTLVPERREEVTTEGGLDVVQHDARIEDVTKQMKDHGMNVNLFIDPNERQIKASKQVGADGIELHTGPYANAVDDNQRASTLDALQDAAKSSRELGLFVAAGHGLNYQNVGPVAVIREVQELNIGHSIVSRSIHTGIKTAVQEMITKITRSNCCS